MDTYQGDGAEVAQCNDVIGQLIRGTVVEFHVYSVVPNQETATVPLKDSGVTESIGVAVGSALYL